MHEKHAVCTKEYIGWILWCRLKKIRSLITFLLFINVPTIISLQPWWGRVHWTRGDTSSLRRQMLLQNCKLILHILVQGILLLKPAKNAVSTALISSNGKKQAPWSRSSWKEKKGTKKFTHGYAFLSLLSPLTGEHLHFFLNTMSRAWEFNFGLIYQWNTKIIVSCMQNKNEKSLKCSADASTMETLGEILLI